MNDVKDYMFGVLDTGEFYKSSTVEEFISSCVLR